MPQTSLLHFFGSAPPAKPVAENEPRTARSTTAPPVASRLTEQTPRCSARELAAESAGGALLRDEGQLASAMVQSDTKLGQEGVACERAEYNGAHSDDDGVNDDDDDGDVMNGVSEYEKERLENMRKNMQMLQSLGIIEASNTMKAEAAGPHRAETSESKTKNRERKRKRAHIESIATPLRRSSRLLSSQENTGGGNKRRKTDDGGAIWTDAAPEHSEEQALPEFGDSSVRTFRCYEGASAVEAAEEEGLQEGGSCRMCAEGEQRDQTDVSGGAHRGVRMRFAGHMELADLQRTYSVDFATCGPSSFLMALGGHGGRVCVAGCRVRERRDSCIAVDGASLGDTGRIEMQPLLSWKAHRGWVSQVLYWGNEALAGDRASSLLLSTANDATIALWDVDESCERCVPFIHMQPFQSSCCPPWVPPLLDLALIMGSRKHGSTPRKLLESDAVHSSGIFSASIHCGRLLTGSKDCTVVLSEIRDNAALSCVRTFADVHNGVVKCVRSQWSGVRSTAGCAAAPCFASSGNDGCVCVVDPRERDNTVAVRVNNVHGGGVVNDVVWHPQNEHLLLSTGADDAAVVTDIRRFDRPHMKLRGHHPTRPRGIHRALWLKSGAHVVATGERTECLTLYDASTGAAESRVDVGYLPTSIQNTELDTMCLLAVPSRRAVSCFFY